jgi:hypothetical protein
MRYESRGYLTTFVSDLETHDVRFLAEHDPDQPFAWVLRPDGTFICYPFNRLSPGSMASSVGFASMVTEAFGADFLRYYWWTGAALPKPGRTGPAPYRLHRVYCAADLDDLMREHELAVIERKRAGELADRGVA